MFQIGDKVVYPMHGAGVIESVERQEILGEMKDYYVLRLPTKNMKVMLPIDRVEKLGVRYIMKRGEFEIAMEIFHQAPTEMSHNWNRRYRENMERIKSGKVDDLISVIRDLQLLDTEKGLSTGEKKMLNDAKQIFKSELFLVLDQTEINVEKLIVDAIANN